MLERTIFTFFSSYKLQYSMSRPKQKPDKFSSKLSGCFPVKGCLQRHHDEAVRRPGGHTAAIVEPSSVGHANPSDPADARLEHTKQWLQNLSTVVNYDPTVMDSPGGISSVTRHGDGSYVGWNDDSPLSAERTMLGCQEQDCCCKRGSNVKNDMPTDVRCSEKDAQFKCPNNSSVLSTAKPQFDDSIATDVKPKLTDSSYISTSTLASNSSRCCSQHRNHRSKKQGKSASVLCSDAERPNSRNECASSIASSSVSLTTELVALNLSDGRPLGITIVGHSSGQRGGDCGIFVGCVKRGGAAAADGRIEPGDLILEVNGIDLEGLTNERALTILRGELSRGGTVQILVAKYWDMENQDDCQREPIYEPVGSVRSSVVGTRHGSLEWMSRPGPLKVIPEDCSRARMFREASGASGSESDHAPSGRFVPAIRSSQQPSIMPPASSLPSLLDRPNSLHYVSRSHSASRNEPTEPYRSEFVEHKHAGHKAAPPADEPFVGADLINWIRSQVVGLANLCDAKAYANDLLQAGYIYTVNRPQQQLHGATMNRFQFHEDEYYVFGRSWDETNVKTSARHHSGAYL